MDDARVPAVLSREQLLVKMKVFEPEGSYFALTLGANRRGCPFWSRQSYWVGWSERNPDWEIRAASLVHPRRMAEAWTAIGQGWVSVWGRRPAEHVDLELHVHHLIPWRMHGPTAEENLVTLCGTCHKGLDPDFEPSMPELARLPGSAKILDPDGTEHRADVSRYREWVARVRSGSISG